jgi:DNA-binding response OmpR family regulator
MDRPLAGRSILIVEDEPIIALAIQGEFEAAGARVVLKRTLQTALVAVEGDAPSAAVLDHALGDGDSSQLCERLKERDIPFVIHSGYSKLDGACKDGVLMPKPAHPEVLVTTVAGLLRSRPVSTETLPKRPLAGGARSA